MGYANGTKANPTYEEVCSHTTGHAETVRVVYDPSQITLEMLLKAFFKAWIRQNSTVRERCR